MIKKKVIIIIVIIMLNRLKTLKYAKFFLLTHKFYSMLKTSNK